jgi:hypothetical protein
MIIDPELSGKIHTRDGQMRQLQMEADSSSEYTPDDLKGKTHHEKSEVRRSLKARLPPDAKTVRKARSGSGCFAGFNA